MIRSQLKYQRGRKRQQRLEQTPTLTKERDIQQPWAASSSTPDTLAAILQQAKALKALVQDQQDNIDRLRHRQNRGGTTELSSSLPTAVANTKPDDEKWKVEVVQRKKKKKRKSREYYRSSLSGSASNIPAAKHYISRVRTKE